MVEHHKLIHAAREVAKNAYAPYSRYRVGAAVEFIDADCAHVFAGCNIENASYGLTICAERAAICAGISAGFTRIKKIAIAVLDADGNPTIAFTPCGACRQFISEFSDDKTLVIVDNKRVWFVNELLPFAFSA